MDIGRRRKLLALVPRVAQRHAQLGGEDGHDGTPDDGGKEGVDRPFDGLPREVGTACSVDVGDFLDDDEEEKREEGKRRSRRAGRVMMMRRRRRRRRGACALGTRRVTECVCGKSVWD